MFRKLLLIAVVGVTSFVAMENTSDARVRWGRRSGVYINYGSPYYGGGYYSRPYYGYGYGGYSQPYYNGYYSSPYYGGNYYGRGYRGAYFGRRGFVIGGPRGGVGVRY